MKAQAYVYALLVAMSLCLSLVGYYRTGSVPILELTIGGVLSTSRTAVERAEGRFSCNCTAHNETNNDSGDAALKFVSSHSAAETLVPITELKEKTRFDTHGGLGFLDHKGLNRYYLCAPATKGDFAKSASNSKQCKERSFLDRDSPVVGLVSFPGSGNTWLRYLLEQATGVYTGSIYCDHSLKALFPGEHVVGGNVLVVKTHRSDSRDVPEDIIQDDLGKRLYDRAVVLVRDPYDALVSEANRRWNSKRYINNHIGLADERAFIGNSQWDWYVEARSNAWVYLLYTWLAHNHRPLHVVQYEKLVDNTRYELVNVLKFLDFPVDNETLNCALENDGRSIFKRKNHLNFDPYSRENKNVVNHVLTQATPLLARYGVHYDKR